MNIIIMKKYINSKLIVLVLLVAAMASCSQEQEVSPVINAKDKSVATIKRTDSHGTNISEGDTIKYTITVSKLVDEKIDFTVDFSDESGIDESDYEVTGGTLAAYTKSTTLEIAFIADNLPEVGEKLIFEVGAFDLGQNWHLSPESDIDEVNTTLNNVNDPDFLTLAFGWEDPEHHSDFDFFTYLGTTAWGAAATSDNPEIDMSISHAYTADPNDYDGTYYAGVDPYDVPDRLTPYTISVGHPDGTVEFFEGTFDMEALDTYTTDFFSPWGMDTYRLLSIEKTGSNYVVTHVNE